MPWWSLFYLFVFGLLSIAGIIEQFRKFETVHGFATLISYIMFNFFVVAYFMPEVASIIGIFIVPMLIYVGLYDWWLSDLDLPLASPILLHVKLRLGGLDTGSKDWLHQQQLPIPKAEDRGNSRLMRA